MTERYDNPAQPQSIAYECLLAAVRREFRKELRCYAPSRYLPISPDKIADTAIWLFQFDDSDRSDLIGACGGSNCMSLEGQVDAIIDWMDVSAQYFAGN